MPPNLTLRDLKPPLAKLLGCAVEDIRDVDVQPAAIFKALKEYHGIKLSSFKGIHKKAKMAAKMYIKPQVKSKKTYQASEVLWRNACER